MSTVPMPAVAKKVPVSALHKLKGFSYVPADTAADPAVGMPFRLDHFRAEKVDGDLALGLPGDLAVERDKKLLDVLRVAASALVGFSAPARVQRSCARDGRIASGRLKGRRSSMQSDSSGRPPSRNRSRTHNSFRSICNSKPPSRSLSPDTRAPDSRSKGSRGVSPSSEMTASRAGPLDQNGAPRRLASPGSR